MADQTAAGGGGLLDNIFSAADGLFQRWMDYERFDAESDLARSAANQNMQARQNSIDAQAAGITTNQLMLFGGIALIAIILLKKL